MKPKAFKPRGALPARSRPQQSGTTNTDPRGADGLLSQDCGQGGNGDNGTVTKHVPNIFTKLRLDPSEDNRRVKAILQYLSAPASGG